MSILIIINDPPYGTERAYNALRLANSLEKLENVEENVVFLMADAVQVAQGLSLKPEGTWGSGQHPKSLGWGSG